jgi:hypothetical protein
MGQGTVSYDISGYCTGQDKIGYTFMVLAEIPPGSDMLTLTFLSPNPPSSGVLRTCVVPGDSSPSATSLTYTFPPVWPVTVTVPAAPGQVVQGDDGKYIYQIDIL